MVLLSHRYARFERIVLGILLVLFFVSGGMLLRKFYVENTRLVPAEGGTYIEGSVGELQPLMPWFTVTNDVNRDMVSLVFSGLQKYNPQLKSIEDDLGHLTVSDDHRIYTVELNRNLFWHDSAPDDPHPVTADDVLFTFRSIQDPQFPNSLLRQNFLGVEMEKINDRTVRFTLDEPYRFFGSNLTLGLLPARSFDGIPVGKLDQALDFGFAPIGAGPYAFKGLVQTELSTEVTLERFERTDDPSYHLKRVVFRIFPDYQTLLSDIRNLDGVRLVPRNEDGDPVIPRSFTAVNYTLPQYVALFLNLDRPILQDRNLRLGLQLGTDKQQIADALRESIIVDTPLLEIDVSDWRYQFDASAAQGALFSSDWHLPEKVRLQRLLEIREANEVGPLRMDPVVYLDTGASLVVTGSLMQADTGAYLNGLRLQEHPSSSGSWIVALPTNSGTGSLQIGQNLLRLEKAGKILDSFYLWRTDNAQQFRRAVEEHRLVEQFVASRDAKIPEDERMTVADLFLDEGMLRRRSSSDPTDIRVNDAGKRLSLTLLTSSSPPQYRQIAEMIKQQWAVLGVHVVIEVPPTRATFEQAVLTRHYDILLFGQSLLDNLDSHPYWHSSGVQRLTEHPADLRIDAYNLSQYSSLEADSLLERIRKSSDKKEQDQSLHDLREALKRDVPAIFLYSPLYTFAYTRDLQGVQLGSLSLHSDRFLTLHRWYVKEEREFKRGVHWFFFVPWLFGRVYET